ncbi:hypothetical protein EKE94_03270 [Mesobaculum littorinae]|uniref:Uncharacterized protein n=1 Tax=Mesobaculum littorinae TaxID=2486419 RepID=A0A438AM85_9RHOB|nr:hypothetical protein [Mesobaculum littorinae]RVV99715.1 hypothetical protein EKE94_03270 [Mesobaculum littorinae]
MDTNATEAEGRARVLALLWDRLDAAGLKPPPRVTGETWAATRRKLTAELAHLDSENLDTLVQNVLDAATGPKRDRSPKYLTIRNYGLGLQQRPLRQARIITSWLASKEGPQAEAGGYLVELFRFVRKHQRPVLPYDMRQIRKVADENARALQRYRERAAAGKISAQERAWCEAYQRDATEARQIIEEGKARRDAA